MKQRLKSAAGLAGLCALALLFTFSLRLYDGAMKKDVGRVIDDRGKQLYQPVRWLEGQWYYRDFSLCLYTPGAMLWHALLFKLFGVKMSVMAANLAVVGAGIAILGYLIARLLMPAGWALLAYLLCLTWNVFALNVGYASWYNGLLGLLALFLMLDYARDQRAWRLTVVGALLGLSLACKVSVGAYQLIGLGLALAWRRAAGRPTSHWRSRLISWEGLCAIATALLGLGLLWASPAWPNSPYFSIPILLASAGVLAGRPASGEAPARRRPFLHEAAWLALGCGVVSAAWILPTVRTVGWAALVDQALLMPLRVSATMQRPLNPPALNAWLSLGLALGGGFWLWRKGRGRPVWALAWSAAVILTAFLPLGIQRMPLRAAGVAWERLRPCWALATTLLGWGLLWSGRVEARARFGLAALLAFGAWNLLTLYPFADDNHLLWCVQPFFILLPYLAQQLSRRMQPAGGRLTPMLVAVPLVCTILLQGYAIASYFFPAKEDFAPAEFEKLDAGRADVYMPEDVARSFRAVKEAVQARTEPGDAIFDTCGPFINFIAERRNPTGVDFFWPRMLTPTEEARAVEQLAAQRPALILRRIEDEVSRPFGKYPSVAESYPALIGFIESNYQLVEQVGPYTLWAPR